MSLAIPPLTRTSSRAFVPAVPGSKALTQRALLLAAQRVGTTRVRGALESDDTAALARALDAFGGLTVAAVAEGFVVTRDRAVLVAPPSALDVGLSGTAARFLLGFASAADGATVVTGGARLRERPMGGLLRALERIGVSVTCLGEPDRLPVRVDGAPIGTRRWRVAAGVSSQFASSLCLLAAQQPPSRAAGPIRIELEGEPVSAPYLDMTLALLRANGVRASRSGATELTVEPGAPRNDEIPIEPDASSLSYFLAAAALTRTAVAVEGLGSDSMQGDVGFARVLGDMGSDVRLAPTSLRLRGGPLRGIDVALGGMPDVVPTLAAVAAFAEGVTHIREIGHLRGKESDRIAALAAELGRLGVAVREGPDALTLRPSGALRPARLRAHGDHRIAMSFAVLGLASPGIEIDDPGCVDKSFPGFWVELERFRRHHEVAPGGGPA